MCLYETEQWVDFVRGVSGEQTQAAMAAHLEAGCAPCRRSAELFGLLAAIAASDGAFEPPEPLLHAARAIWRRTVRRPSEVERRAGPDPRREVLLDGGQGV